MEVFVQHRTINGGAETALDVDSMWPIRESSQGGRRRVADTQLTVALDSPAHRHLNAAFLDRHLRLRRPIRLRVEDHDGMWYIRRVRLPPPNDTRVQVSLFFARPA